MSNNDIVPGFDSDTKLVWEKGFDIQLKKFVDVPESLVLHLSGRVNIYNADFFYRQILLATGAGFIRLVFNCAKCDSVSSAFIGVLAHIRQDLMSQGGDVVLIEVPPKVYECFQRLGFSQFFEIMENLKDAARFFKKAMQSLN